MTENTRTRDLHDKCIVSLSTKVTNKIREGGRVSTLKVRCKGMYGDTERLILVVKY